MSALGTIVLLALTHDTTLQQLTVIIRYLYINNEIKNSFRSFLNAQYIYCFVLQTSTIMAMLCTEIKKEENNDQSNDNK